MRFSNLIPKTPMELERFYLDVIKKLGDTDTTLSDEDQKSLVPFISMVYATNRKLDQILADTHLRRPFKEDRNKQENRVLRAQITRLESRVAALEKEIP